MAGGPLFGTVNSATVTVLVDNYADLIARSTDTVQRFTKAPLLAEHGFAALVETDDGAWRILWDTGATRTALLENARRMEIDLSTIDAIALSHAHFDHTGAVGQVLSLTARVQPRRWPSDVTMEEIERTYV